MFYRPGYESKWLEGKTAGTGRRGIQRRSGPIRGRKRVLDQLRRANDGKDAVDEAKKILAEKPMVSVYFGILFKDSQFLFEAPGDGEQLCCSWPSITSSGRFFSSIPII